jgi:cell filamentation protein
MMQQRKTLRYREPTGAEGATQPGSRGRVLANLKGITSKRAMDLAEYEALVAAQEQYATTLTAETRFTAELLRSMHRDWLSDLYAWAGQYRTVELQKRNFAWPPAYRVEENMMIFETETLARLTPCRPGPLDRVAEAAATVHADLLLIHPFRDGNGRLARWLADLMFAQAGFPVPDYGFVGRGSVPRREAYLGAVMQGYLQNYAPLASFFVEAIRRRERREVLR